VALELIDTHAHLDDEQFQPDLPAVIDRAVAAGVGRIITIATTGPSSAACVSLAAKYPQLWATVGIQPNHVSQAAPTDWDDVVRLVDAPGVAGIGETGLDRHWDYTPFPQQEDYFARHLELARRKDLAAVIHCRDAEADVVRMLRDEFEKHGPVKGVMHSFTGDQATAEACLAMGLHLSFAGMLTYKSAQNLRDVAVTIPLDRLLVETDSPYLAPVPLRGKRNEPANLVHTAACLANVKNAASEVISQWTMANARELFAFRET
jgi:TatD DNase family protein